MHLESRVSLEGKSLSTQESQEQLILEATNLATPKDPEWLNVAGRLHTWNWTHDVVKERGFSYGNLDVFNKYTIQLLAYSRKDLKEALSWINPKWDKDFDIAGARLLTQRYLAPNELIQEMFLATALVLAIPEEAEHRMKWAKHFYLAIAQRKISLATPIVANLRFENGSATSCFIMAVEDSIESIFQTVTNTARISQEGGGVGICVSAIRSVGSWVRGKPCVSGGVMSWIKVLNDTAIAVNQGG